MTCRAGVAALFGSLLSCLAGVLAAPAQPNLDPAARFAVGTHAFRRILSAGKLQPLKNLEDLDDSGDALVVILGDTTPLERLDQHLHRLGGLKQFV